MKHLSLAILLLSLSACSSKPVADAPVKVDESPQINQAVKVDESKPLTDGIAAPMVEPVQTEETVDVTLRKASPHLDEINNEEKSDDLPEKTESNVVAKSNGIDPEKALTYLKNGNKRFLKGSLRADGQSKKDIKRLSQIEKP